MIRAQERSEVPHVKTIPFTLFRREPLLNEGNGQKKASRHPQIQRASFGQPVRAVGTEGVICVGAHRHVTW